MAKQENNIENQEIENKASEEVIDEGAAGADTMAPEAEAQTAAAADSSDKLAEECKAWQDKYVRLSAEFDNFRKRTLKEKMDLIASGGEDVIKAIIPVVDDFERAIAAMAGKEEVAAECEGVRLIYQKFMDILKSKGVTPIEAIGKSMDVDFHDAVAKIPVDDPEKKGTVIDVVQTGYMLKDKVLRFAKVVVGE
ncbi:nucleotide exchange factor GrpE [Millionella massiliensis]|uniref:nucleotide exchange factor GrpE n=1 Tax=Millionella massiliensis TaxID=1871023 RepID=UPI0024B73A9D|nr:nucleotide exchange factor GrpE [Millionella massiliensis]